VAVTDTREAYHRWLAYALRSVCVIRAALGLLALSLLAIACDCPRSTDLVVKRHTVGDVQYQIGSEMFVHNGLEIVDRGAIILGYDDGGFYPPGNLGFRLTIGDIRQLDSVPPPFVATVIVKSVSLGASEIALDDERAGVSAQAYTQPDTPYHDVTGHLSIRELVQACAWDCPMRASGTLTISAVGPNGETFSFDATFSAADETREGMCISNT
jgi:hypothetical protein